MYYFLFADVLLGVKGDADEAAIKKAYRSVHVRAPPAPTSPD